MGCFVMKSCYVPWIVVGDFAVICSPGDVHGLGGVHGGEWSNCGVCVNGFVIVCVVFVEVGG